MPFVFCTSSEAKHAADASIEDKEQLFPDEDSDGYAFEGSAWAFKSSIAELLDKCEEDDNLHAVPPGKRRRVQLIADAMGWTARTGCARMMIRSPDTKRMHNNPRYSVDNAFILGDDKAESMSALAKLGGADGLYETVQDSLKVTKLKDHELDEAGKAALADPLWAPFSCVQVDPVISVPRKDGSTIEVDLGFGADLASACSMGATGGPTDKFTGCDKCILRRPDFHNAAKIRTARRRNFANTTALAHINPFKESILGKRG